MISGLEEQGKDDKRWSDFGAPNSSPGIATSQPCFQGPITSSFEKNLLEEGRDGTLSSYTDDVTRKILVASLIGGNFVFAHAK